MAGGAHAEFPSRVFPMLCIASAIAAAGCVISSAHPRADQDFARLESLASLNGVYRNRGEREPGAAPMFLSALIWPTVPTLDHAAVETVDVRAVAADTLVVRAVGQSSVMEEGTFVAGRHFEFANGRLRIKHAAAAFSQGPDDPLAGPRVEDTELGIDLAGSGKYRTEMKAAGLVFLIIPVAAHISEDVRFPRVGP